MYKYQQKGEDLQEINFTFSELFQVITNHESKDITDPLKVYVYVQTIFNLAVIAKTIRHEHSAVQKAIDYAQRIEREFLPFEGI